MEGRRVAAHCRPEAVDGEPDRTCLALHVGGRVVRAARILVPRDCPLSGNPNSALDRQVLAGQRPLAPTGAGHALYLGLLGHFQGVIDLDAEVTNRTLQLRVS
jgi:hypothetical protein